jgi:hypothetical protein
VLLRRVHCSGRAREGDSWILPHHFVTFKHSWWFFYVNFHGSVLSAAHACEGCLGGMGCIRFQKYVILGFRMAHFRLLVY